jgi:hypothetical protein
MRENQMGRMKKELMGRKMGRKTNVVREGKEDRKEEKGD